MKNNHIKEKMILFLMKNYETQTSLTKLIFPEYKKQKVHPSIKNYFLIFKELCEIKETQSNPVIRKNNIKPYTKKIIKYRIDIKKYIKRDYPELYKKINKSKLYFKVLKELSDENNFLTIETLRKEDYCIRSLLIRYCTENL